MGIGTSTNFQTAQESVLKNEEGVAVLDRSILYLRPDKLVPLKN